jgi:hypothetical protein
LDELLWARLIFALGAVVTAATVVMILRGHLYWNRTNTPLFLKKVRMIM